MDVYDKTGKSVVGVQTVALENVNKYGIIDPADMVNEKLMKVATFIEKPAIDQAPSQLAILGRYVLTRKFSKNLKRSQQVKDMKSS